jgi:hypothetical protein
MYKPHMGSCKLKAIVFEAEQPAMTEKRQLKLLLVPLPVGRDEEARVEVKVKLLLAREERKREVSLYSSSLSYLLLGTTLCSLAACISFAD